MEFKRIDNKNMYIATRGKITVLKSYNKIIAIIDRGIVYINENYYNYSKTTKRHLHLFLEVDAKTFEKNCKNNDYIFIPDNVITEMYYGIE